jgi:hypothetical protein
MIRTTAFACLFFLISSAAHAATLLQTNGSSFRNSGIGVGNGQQAGAVGFSTDRRLENVEIYVPLSNSDPSAPHNVTAYLTDRIGPGTTAADVLDQRVFAIASGEDREFQAMSIAALDPGTYYLMLIDTAFNYVGWESISFNGLSIAASPGVAYVASLAYAQESGSFPPAFDPNGDTRDASIFPGAHSVRIVGTAIPEPASLTLAAVALAAVRRRRVLTAAANSVQVNRIAGMRTCGV